MLGGAIAVALYHAFLVAAGRIDWPAAWLSMGIYAAISGVNFFLVSPDLVRERSWGLIPAIVGAGGFVLRTWLEDRFLLRELEGYA